MEGVVDGGTGQGRVLVVEDDPSFAALLRGALLARSAGEGHANEPLAGRPPARSRLIVDVVHSFASALHRLSSADYTGVVVDRGLPDGDGFELLGAGASRAVPPRFLVLSADATAASAMEAVRRGAAEYVVKDAGGITRAVRAIEGWLSQVDPAPARAGHDGARGADRLVGSGRAMAEIRARLRQLARSPAPVLIEGETGTGKELVARALHEESARARGPFVPVNCGAVAEQLAESELFGHVRGSFTGALRDHVGLLEQADRGTLFLDEIEDLPLALQGKLLRFLQEAEIRPLGAARLRRVDVRVVAASNQDLLQMVAARRVRLDLLHRIRVLTLRLPPLRCRLEDLPELLGHLVRRRLAGAALAGEALMTPAILERLRQHAWSGNVRELEAVVERAVTLRAGRAGGLAWEEALAEELGSPAEVSPLPPAGSVDGGDTRPAVELPRERTILSERDTLLDHLARHRWRRAETARGLGISRVTLWRRMRRAGLLDPRGEPVVPGGAVEEPEGAHEARSGAADRLDRS